MKKTIAFLAKHKFAFLTLFGIVIAGVFGGLLNVGHDLVANAQIFDPQRDLPDNIANAGGDQTLRELILTVVNYFLTFVGIIAVIMLMWGGFQYMVKGEEGKDQARNTIIYAIVGIIIILFSFAIVNTVFDVTTGQGTGNI